MYITKKPVPSEQLREFIQQDRIKSLLQDYDFTNLYDKLYLTTNISAYDISTFTQMMYYIGIDPLKYMDYIPNYYLSDYYIKDFIIPTHIQSIREQALNGWDGNIIYYEGTHEGWKNIVENSYEDLSHLKVICKEDLKESYLDDEEQFYDYQTQEVTGKDIFDITKTGMSYYDNFLNPKDLQYMREKKGLDGVIEYMTPKEYFKNTAKFFGKTPEQDIKNALANKENIEHLKQVIQKYKRKFPLPYLDFSNNQQEGRHRMAVAGELFGWDKKFPVLIIRDY